MEVARNHRRLFRTTLFSLLIALLPGTVGATEGEELFAMHCAACHGDNGDGGIGVPLALPDFLSSVTDEYLFQTIRHGRPGRIMPAFQHLEEEQAWAIVRHIRGWGKDGVQLTAGGISGDPARGREIFARKCARCHGPLGEGGAGTGVNFTRLHDIPIVAPALNNAGYLAAATDDIIRTTLLKGRRGTPMQPARKMGLSAQDVDDVVAYIRSFEKGFRREERAEEPSPTLLVTSHAPFAETVEAVKKAISSRRLRVIRQHPLEDGLVTQGSENRKQLVIHFGQIRQLNTLLALDPRMGLFLPNRITVMEQDDGKVLVAAVNPLRFSSLFNNANLEHTARELHDTYMAILQEISR